jgi:hypothetical protein
MFANLNIQQMTVRFPELAQIDDANDVVSEFMRLDPEYPIVKVRVNPGEVYVAPTEIILHDGSCVGKEFIDAQVTLLGPFTLGAVQRAFASNAEVAFVHA